MEIRWSPRKRIRLDRQKPSNLLDNSVVDSNIVSNASIKDSDNTLLNSAGKRNSSDFDRELDECLDMTENTFNPTQVFLVDPDMELAMLRVDMELQSSMSTPHESCKSTQNHRPLSRWDTAPLFDLTNPIMVPNRLMKRHISEPFHISAYPQICTTQQTVLVDELDGIDIAELSAIADGAQHAFVLQPLVSTQDSVDSCKKFYSRCKVLGISEDFILDVFDEKRPNLKRIFLQGVWRESLLADAWQLQVGDSIELLAESSKSFSKASLVFGDSTTLFPDIVVFHPQIFISSTTLSGSANCHRKSVLQNRIVAPQVGPIPTDSESIARAIAPIVGNCVHEALQAATLASNFSPEFIRQAGATAVSELMLPAVWLSGASPALILAQLETRLEQMSEWGKKVWPKIGRKILGCETEVKGLGVSGKLDMDIEDVAGHRSCIEIKTGKQSSIHVGQIVLYYLLQSFDDLQTPCANQMFLLYLPSQGSAETIQHTISPRECQNIVRNRNLLASHNAHGFTLPEVVVSRECTFCPLKAECDLLANPGAFGKYMQQWLRWIDAQTGSVSAARRMRGNLLNLDDEWKQVFSNTLACVCVKDVSRLMSSDKRCGVINGISAKSIVSLLKKKNRVILCCEEIQSVLISEIRLGVGDDLITWLRDKGDSESASDPTDLPSNWAEQAEDLETSRLLFGCSLKGVQHDILSKGNFDLAIVLKAESVTDPNLWPIALRAKKILLCGSTDDENNLLQRITRAIENQETQP